MANAQGAVLQALRPIAAVALPARVSAGATVSLDGSGSAAACGHKIVGYQWTVTEPAGSSGLLKNPGAAAASLVAPSGSSVYQVMLTVTDDAGRVDSAPVIITSAMANSAAPANAGGDACLSVVSYSQTAPTSGASGTGSSAGGGGGGAVDPATMLLGLMLAAAAAQRRYARRSAASSHSRCARR
jgi:serine protease